MSKPKTHIQKTNGQSEIAKLKAENARLQEQLEIAGLELIYERGGARGESQALINEFLRQKKILVAEVQARQEELELYQQDFPKDWLDTIFDNDKPHGSTDVTAFFAFSDDQGDPQSILLWGRSPLERAKTIANIMELWSEAVWMLPHPLEFGGKNIDGLESEDWANIFQSLAPFRYASDENQYRIKRTELFNQYWPKIAEKNPNPSRSDLQTNFNRTIERTMSASQARRFSQNHEIMLITEED